MLKKLGLTCLLLSCLVQAGATANTFEINFGNLYGADRDKEWGKTVVVSGEGTLADELVGSELYWGCLDQYLVTPANRLLTFNVSKDWDVLTNGIWGIGPSPGLPAGVSLSSNAEVILSAVANIYFNNEVAILTDFSASNEGPGQAFQAAVWVITTSYYQGYWSGALTPEILEDLARRFTHEEYPLEATYLLSASDGSKAQGREVFYGNIVVEGEEDLTIQTVMLVKVPDPIPEPSSVVLMIGAAGVVGFIVRRGKQMEKRTVV